MKHFARFEHKEIDSLILLIGYEELVLLTKKLALVCAIFQKYVVEINKKRKYLINCAMIPMLRFFFL